MLANLSSSDWVHLLTADFQKWQQREASAGDRDTIPGERLNNFVAIAPYGKSAENLFTTKLQA